MTVLLVDAGPVGFRLGRMSEDRIVAMHHQFPHRHEPRLGDIYRAKIHTKDARLGGAFCLMDDHGTQGFLAVKGQASKGQTSKGQAHRVGETILVGVRREAIGDKACQLTPKPALRLPGATVRQGETGISLAPGPAGEGTEALAISAGEAAFGQAGMGRVGVDPPLLGAVTSMLDRETNELRVTDPDAAAMLRPWLEPLGIEVSTFDSRPVRAMLDEAEEAALDRRVALPGGGRVVFDEAEALVAIDVDTAGRDARSAKGAQEAVAAAMLSVIGEQAALRSLGGQIVVDLPRRAFASPKVLRDRLTKALAPIGRVSVPAITNEGVVVVIAPRGSPSLMDRLTEPHGDGVRPARRLRADVVAARAGRLLEAALIEDRSARLALSCPQRALPYLEEAASTFSARYGARFDLIPGEGNPHVR